MSSIGGGSKFAGGIAPKAAPGIRSMSARSGGGGSSTFAGVAPKAAPGIGAMGSSMNVGGAEPTKRRGVKDMALGGLKTIEEHMAGNHLRANAATAALNWKRGRSAPSDSDYSNPGDYR